MDYNFDCLTNLAELLRKNGEYNLVLEGKAKLTLPVQVLEKLNKFHSHQETNFSSELLQDVQYIQELIKRTPKLKLSHLKNRPLVTTIDISKFVSLKYIELVRVNLKRLKGFQALRPQLEVLGCSLSGENIEQVLALEDEVFQVWDELRTVDLSYNNIEILGTVTFAFTPWIQYLDLSRNKLSEIDDSLEYLNNLKCLNLSYNHFVCLPRLTRESNRKLEALLMSHNIIEDITGVWLLDNLSKLDLSYNLLEDHSSLTSLSELKKLQYLDLNGNPVSYHRNHRTYTCAYLSKTIPTQNLVLDNKKLSSKEHQVLGTRISSRPYGGQYHEPSIGNRYGRMASIASSNETCNTVISSSNQNLASQLADDDFNGSVTRTGNGGQVAQSLSKSTASGNRKMPRITEAVIVDDDTVVQPIVAPPKLDGFGGTEHLETKRQIESLRQNLGEDHWLESCAGSFVQDLLGLQKTPYPASVLSEIAVNQVISEDDIVFQSKTTSKLLGSKSKSPSNENIFGVNSRNTNSSINSKNERLLKDSIDDKNISNVSNSTLSVGDASIVNNNVNNETGNNTKMKLTYGDNVNEAEESVLSMAALDVSSATNNSFASAIGDSSTAEFTSSNDSDKFNYNYEDDYERRNDIEDDNVNDDCDNEDDDDDDDNSSHSWLVQKVCPKKLEEVFVVLKEKYLLEKDPLNNRTLVKWELSALESCVKINALPPTVQLTFDTVRRHCRERKYVMEVNDCQVLLQKLGDLLESRSLTAMKQMVFRCMNCSALFSKEMKNTVRGNSVINCNICGSNIVVKVDENDADLEHLPAVSKSPNVNRNNILSDIFTAVAATATSFSLGSNSVINNNYTNAGFDGSANNNNNNNSSANTNHVNSTNQSKLSASPSQCSIGSAASLDQSSSRESPAAGLGDNCNTMLGVQSMRCDSDIEIISNPSQSSIEVLEVQARFQGTNTPNRKRSSEERQTVAVPQLTTVQEVVVVANSNTAQNTSTNASSNTPALLTESSSSGSLTDSICTAYENHPSMSGARRQQPQVVDKFVEEASAENSPDNKSTIEDNLLQGQLNVSVNTSTILEGLFDTSKLEITPVTILSNDTIDVRINSQDVVVESNKVEKGKEEEDEDDDVVKYNYTDFSQVDHRIKLFLYEKLFKKDDEDLVLLLRGNIYESRNLNYAGCLVFSTYSCFLLKVVGKENGDDASNFFDKVFVVPLSKISLQSVSWDQGVIVSNNSNNNKYLLLLHDSQRVELFFNFLSNVDVPCQISRYIPSRVQAQSDDGDCQSEVFVDGECYMMLQNVLSANNNIKDSNNVCTLSVTCLTTVRRDNEEDVAMAYACIANTSSDLFILTPDLGWLYTGKEETPVIYTVHNIINLIDVDVNGCQLSLHFLDESEGIEESWIFQFATASAVDNIIESIRKPWEAIFSVPLHVTQFNK